MKLTKQETRMVTLISFFYNNETFTPATPIEFTSIYHMCQHVKDMLFLTNPHTKLKECIISYETKRKKQKTRKIVA